MSGRRLAKSWLVLAGLLPFPLAFGACDRGAPEATLGAVPPFSLTERSGRRVTLDDLAGRVWIADFIFTRCGGPCPRMTGSMARLASEFASSSDVRFVSFSVDPENDTPAVLDAYAKSYGADPERWLFLTGDPDAIRTLCHDGFRLGFAAAPPGEAAPGAEVAHSTRFVVVGRDGRIAGYYDDEDADSMRRLRETVADLLRR